MLFVHAEGEGNGTPVVVSHALGLDHTMWRDLTRALAPTRRVLAYDHRGHGKSRCAVTSIDLMSLVADAARVIEQLDRGPVVFIGLSMGGMVAQGLAIQRPDLVRGLVLANTVAVYSEAARLAWAQRATLVEEQGMAALVELVLSRYLHHDFRATHPEIERFVTERILACDPACYAATCHAIAQVNWLDDLPGIRCPTLVLAGALDQGATPAMAQDITRRIVGARLEIMETSHLSAMESPDEFYRHVSAHLAVCDRV